MARVAPANIGCDDAQTTRPHIARNECGPDVRSPRCPCVTRPNIIAIAISEPGSAQRDRPVRHVTRLVSSDTDCSHPALKPYAEAYNKTQH